MRPLSPSTLSSAPIWHENIDKSFAKAILLSMAVPIPFHTTESAAM